MTSRLLTALIFTLAALPVHAQVYKWVDAKGQVNYSNAPPPSVTSAAQVVEEQISVMGLDPAVRAYAEKSFAERARQDEADWQQRQRAMSTQAAAAPSYNYATGYSGDYYPTTYGYGGYYGGYGYLRRAAIVNRPGGVLPPRVVHHHSRRPVVKSRVVDPRR